MAKQNITVKIIGKPSGHRQTIFLRKPLEVRLFDARDVCVDLALGKAIQLCIALLNRQQE